MMDTLRVFFWTVEAHVLVSCSVSDSRSVLGSVLDIVLGNVLGSCSVLGGQCVQKYLGSSNCTVVQ